MEDTIGEIAAIIATNIQDLGLETEHDELL